MGVFFQILDRLHFGTLIFLAMILAFAVSSGCEKPVEPFRVGYIGSLSGKYSALGTNARNGAILAVEKANSEGGIAGRPLELVIRDDEGEPEKALEAAQEFADMGLRFIIGPFITASGTRIMPFVNDRGILTISPTNMGANLEDRDDYFFKLNPSTREYGKRIADYFLVKGYTRLGSISDKQNDPYCPTFVEGYDIPINSSGATHVAVAFDGAQRVNYTETASHVLRNNAGAVLICASALDTAILTQHLKKVDPGIFVMSAPWGISKELIENGGYAVDNLHFFMSVEYGEPSPRSKSFVDMFRSRFNQEAGFASIFNYEAISILVTALRQSPEGKPDEIKETLLKASSHKGVQGDFRLDPEGDPVKPFFLHRIQEGEFRRVK